MAHRKIQLEYVRDAVGHPEAGTVVTVERTQAVESLIELGIAVDLGNPDKGGPGEEKQLALRA